MTVEKLLQLAARVGLESATLGEAKELAAAVTAMFRVSFPCDYEEPAVTWGRASDQGLVGSAYVAFDDNGYLPDEARGIAIAMLRTADAAEL